MLDEVFYTLESLEWPSKVKKVPSQLEESPDAYRMWSLVKNLFNRSEVGPTGRLVVSANLFDIIKRGQSKLGLYI